MIANAKQKVKIDSNDMVVNDFCFNFFIVLLLFQVQVYRSVLQIEFLVKSEYCFQYKKQPKQQNSAKLDKEAGLRIALAAEHDGQSKTQDRKWRNVVDDLIDDFHIAFYNAKKYAKKADKRHCNNTHKEIQNDAEFIEFGVLIILVFANKNQAQKQEHK